VTDPHSCGEDVEDDFGAAYWALRWVAIEHEDPVAVHPDETFSCRDRDHGQKACDESKRARLQPDAERSGEARSTEGNEKEEKRGHRHSDGEQSGLAAVELQP